MDAQDEACALNLPFPVHAWTQITFIFRPLTRSYTIHSRLWSVGTKTLAKNQREMGGKESSSSKQTMKIIEIGNLKLGI